MESVRAKSLNASPHRIEVLNITHQMQRCPSLPQIVRHAILCPAEAEERDRRQQDESKSAVPLEEEDKRGADTLKGRKHGSGGEQCTLSNPEHEMIGIVIPADDRMQGLLATQAPPETSLPAGYANACRVETEAWLGAATQLSSSSMIH